MKSENTDTVHWGNTRIHYYYEYSQRKTLAISVHPDLSVTVKAPIGAEIEVIREKVRKRAGWIKKAQREFELYLPKQPPRRYVNGETHRYLGRQYRLKVIQGEDEMVKCLRGYFWVTITKEDSKDYVKRLMEKWYKEKAMGIFSERMDICCSRFNSQRIENGKFVIRKMTTRWGSCSSAGRITLNLELIKAPKDCIDYVITHELCHLIESHHGPGFWRLIQKVMPDYAERRRRLNMYADV
jgi:predicted metal-dependent hydrolase